jgi:hypothetical protein
VELAVFSVEELGSAMHNRSVKKFLKGYGHRKGTGARVACTDNL